MAFFSVLLATLDESNLTSDPFVETDDVLYQDNTNVKYQDDTDVKYTG